MSDNAQLRVRYESGGDTLPGTTTAGALFIVGSQLGIQQGTFALFATLMIESGGPVVFGRGKHLGNKKLAAGDAYTFDYVDISNIVLQDGGTPAVFTLDYTGP